MSCCFFCIAQKTDAGLNPKIAYKKAIVIGGNYTYVFDTETINGVDYDSRYNEHTVAINFAFDFSRHFRLGVDYKKIFTQGNLSGKNKYQLIGAFAQYKFLRQKENYFFGELGFYKGNYCTCGQDVPYKKSGVSYLSWGGGYNFKLKKNLHLDLAFTSAQALGKNLQPYAFTQYIIGLDYALFLKGKAK